MNVDEVIQELIETYRSIDIRVFSFMQNDAWHNMFTIIRFRRETVEELKEDHRKVSDKCEGIIETEEFRVGIFQFEIEEWKKIKSELSNESLCLENNFRLNYSSPTHFNYSAGDANNNSHKEFVFKGWKTFNADIGTRNVPEHGYRDKLSNKAIEHHFSSFDDYLGAIFEYDRRVFQREKSFIVIAPVYLQVIDIKFEHDKVVTRIFGHHQNDLQIVFNFYRGGSGIKTEFLGRKVGDIILEEKEELIQKEITLNIDTKSLPNQFELLIIKNEKILLEETVDEISKHWTGIGEYSNPFYFIFEKFVGCENLKKMLFELKVKDMKDPAKIFEGGVSLLLSMLHMPNITLGKFEKIGTGADTVSMDIIGMHDKNHILLVNVTTGLPKQSDFDRERKYREILKKQLTNRKIEITSVYFTAEEPTESQNSAEMNNVNLIGRSQILTILEHIKDGNLEKAQKIILDEIFVE